MRQMLIAAGCLMAAMPLGWIGANTVSSPANGKEPRFPQLALEQLDEQQRPVGEKIVKISSVGLGGPYNPMLRSPVYAQRMYDLLDYLRWHTSVPTKLNEMAILIVGRQWRSQVEWFAHAPLAIKAGLSPEIAKAVAEGRRPAGMSDDEATIYEFCIELQHNQSVSDATYAVALAKFGEQGIIDMVGVNGFYTYLAMVINVAHTPLPKRSSAPTLAAFPR